MSRRSINWKANEHFCWCHLVVDFQIHWGCCCDVGLVDIVLAFLSGQLSSNANCSFLAWPSQDVFLLPHIPWIGQVGVVYFLFFNLWSYYWPVILWFLWQLWGTITIQFTTSLTSSESTPGWTNVEFEIVNRLIVLRYLLRLTSV